jgi:hypothetical protein
MFCAQLKNHLFIFLSWQVKLKFGYFTSLLLSLEMMVLLVFFHRMTRDLIQYDVAPETRRTIQLGSFTSFCPA